MNKYWKGMVVFLAIFLLIPFVSAVPPVTQTAFLFEEGFEIQPTLFSPISQNKNFTFNFHVYNYTTGLLLNRGDYSCTFHLFNSSTGMGIFGLHGLIPETGKHVVHAYVAGENLTELGEYHVNIHCNDSRLGGYFDFIFEVTPSGIETDEIQSNLLLAYILGILGVAFILSILMYTFRPTEDSNIGLHMSLMRMVLFFMCLYTLVSGLGLIVTSAREQTLSTVYMNQLLAPFDTMVYFIWIAAIITVIFFFFDLMWTFKKLGEKEG